MKVTRFHEFGDPGVLHYEDAELPDPGPGQVRLQVAGTSFNSVDGNIRAGRMQGPIPVSLPHTPGFDVAGTVDALGDGVTRVQVGDRVIGLLPMTDDGASAEYVIAPADALTPAPTTIPLADAAALPCVALTAWQALFDSAGLRNGQRVLVNGGGGAVGGYAIQLAKAAGATVLATASPRSHDQVASAGADEILDHTTGDVADLVKEPVDVLLNLAPIDPGRLTALLARVRDGGVLVSTTVWMPAPADEGRGVRAADVFVRSDPRQLAELVSRVDTGALAVAVAERVALAELADVHARAEAGTLSGKIIVRP